MFIPKLLIGVGLTGAYFTLRETYEHKTYIRGEGDMGGCINNGVYQGSVSVEIRSFHHCNLSQDADEAFEKAVVASEQMAIPLYTTRESLTAEMRDIQRSNAEQLAEHQRKMEEQNAFWKEQERIRMEQYLEVIAAGVFPIGNYAGKSFRDVPVSYINWYMNTKFDNELMLEIQKAVVATCEDLKLPATNPTQTIGSPGLRLEFKNVTVIRQGGFNTDFGWCNCITMVTSDGTCLVSMGKFNANVGEKFCFKATVKSHKEYRGQAQTIVNRVKAI